MVTPREVHRISIVDGSKVACVDTWSGASNNAKYDRRGRMSIWDWKTAKMLHEWIDASDILSWGNVPCWLPGDEQGWGWYRRLLMIADGDNNADEIVAIARDKVNAATHIIPPQNRHAVMQLIVSA